MLSCIPPERGFKVYDPEFWESGTWDALQYGRTYDFKRPFFAQLMDLLRVVPLPGLAVLRASMENSDYTNGISGAKNCYLLFSASYNEDCMFSRSLFKCKDVVDCCFAVQSEICYDCTDITNCYNLKYSEHCTSCSDSTFLYNCQGCRNCYGCVNLSQQDYCFFNEKLSRESYLSHMADLDLGSRQVVEEERKRFNEFRRPFPLKAYFGKNNEDSSGNYISNCSNVRDAFLVTNTEDSEHCVYLDAAKDSLFHCMFGNRSELIYNCVSVGEDAFNIRFCQECWQGVSDLEYCMHTRHGASNCFGCIGVTKKSYCILNKEYSKSEYLDLSSRIRAQMRKSGEYGAFFPKELSPFYFNRSAAIDYLPLSRKEALERGFRWEDSVSEPYDEMIEALPDHIKEVGEQYLNTAFQCSQSAKKYKLIKAELAFYKKHNIPAPLVAPLERLYAKGSFYRLQDLHTARCAKKGEPILSPHQAGGQPIYCDDCFREEVY